MQIDLTQIDVNTLRDILTVIGPFVLRVGGGIAVLIAGMIACRIARRAARGLFQAASLDSSLVEVLASSVYYLLVAVLVIAVFGVMGVETASLITILGASSLAIGLALQGSLSNFASGVMLMIFRPFKAGDFIETGDFEGHVVEMGAFSTMLDTPDKRRVVVPNAYIAEKPIENWSTNAERRLDLTLEISIASDLGAARRALLAMLAADSRVLRQPEPQIGVDDFGDTSMRLVVRPWCAPDDWWALRYELPERMKEAVERAGGAMPTPQREILFPAGVPKAK
ncbi:mechanosensitive ion channel family protein [Accumulibacter sp.]|uniref:mechanosensitive ion channel family protein n=1 Tax=Accumulibacter sp. TaxID=2053492 RepID=UPI001DF77175|nr:mechanosensitive ion channel family protein [Accumulibacter sp.]MCB1932848.1 mechanosensitive ion channel family protein [Accumulibacter sp.]MCP5227962.1 mechanosensitive ion channel family protein [Accumulibacter sp.]